jgi:hypothetical protein
MAWRAIIPSYALKMIAFWGRAPCSLVEVDQRFRGANCLHHQCDDGGSKHLWNVCQLRDYGAVSQKGIIFKLAALRTLNLLSYISFGYCAVVTSICLLTKTLRQTYLKTYYKALHRDFRFSQVLQDLLCNYNTHKYVFSDFSLLSLKRNMRIMRSTFCPS